MCTVKPAKKIPVSLHETQPRGQLMTQICSYILVVIWGVKRQSKSEEQRTV